MDLGLSAKRAVVTGTSDGIGKAIVAALTGEGARVVGASRREVQGAPSEGYEHHVLDLAQPHAPSELIELAVRSLGGLDILVNNAGVGTLRAGFAAMTDEEWLDTLNLNLMAAVRAMRAALPHLAANGGVIVNVASVNAVVPIVEAPDYSTSKAALLSAGKSVASEYARRGVRVVTVSPAAVATPFWLGPAGIAAQVEAATGTPAADVVAGAAEENPLGRLLTPAEVADVVTFLASPRASAVTGTDVRVDGGYIHTM